MIKINKHIEIVRSSKVSLSSMGAASCEAIREVLASRFQHVGITIVNTFEDLELLAAKRPDLVFLGMKNVPSESGDLKVWVSEYLESKGINYTGSPGEAIQLDFHKPAAKQAVLNAGLNTSPYFLAVEGLYANADELPLQFPLFIKPPSSGGGQGINDDSVIRNFAGFEQRVSAIAKNFGTDVLVEEYLPGREFSVAILEALDSDILTAMPLELVTERNQNGDRILSRKIKMADTESAIAITDEKTKSLVSDLAVDVFRALGARGFGRIDIRMDRNDRPQFLEANLVPCLIKDYGNFPKACRINQDMSFEAMLLRIVELGMAQKEETLCESETPLPEFYTAPIPLVVAS